MSSSPLAQTAAAAVARPARPRRLRPFRVLFVLLIFAVSLIPAIATIDNGAKSAPDLVEMRPLAPLPTHWEGRWYDFDKNYRNFEKGYSDHLGLRSLMIRTKNELDLRLFHTSRRVYFGKQGEMYGRSISDIELPATETLLAVPTNAELVYQGMAKVAAQLKAQGTTMILMTPMSKQYFTQDRIPFFLPRIQQPSHFMQLYRRFEQTPEFHFVDVYGILAASQGKFPIFYRQDFHWTDLTALKVAEQATNRIASLEGRGPAWSHPLAYHTEAFDGSEARFAAVLSNGVQMEPQLTKTWQDVHQVQTMDARKTGFESITDTVGGRGLLPATCLFGNSFSDGMMRAGLADHFEQFIRLDRAMMLKDTPPLIRGRCKYMIVQVLDNSAGAWLSLAE
ncbi:alginate O-acetyltransferase AlgX-related protein [Rugamonas rivuli]|uniref:AlgX/AlgJ SGNH hydrolase-like domain-containing protein n=1 Tax=Rugamonas rivuli TaxID=2743358 RepID=A0A843S7N2_9BURK|nr:hypothetical protein [Rugamonas rivuli]MQA20425.1 hypothetical protein [Rugamonas rivuli]